MNECYRCGQPLSPMPIPAQTAIAARHTAAINHRANCDVYKKLRHELKLRDNITVQNPPFWNGLQNVTSYASFDSVTTALSLQQEFTRMAPTATYTDLDVTRLNGLWGTLPGGVHKKYSPADRWVFADKDGGGGDYANEDQAMGALGNNAYFSYQHPLTHNVTNQQHRRLRAVSNYSLNAAHVPAPVADTMNNQIAIFNGQHNKTRDAIYQMLKIHHELYESRIMHGDMHMGNIKVLEGANTVFVKAFDFGKAAFNVKNGQMGGGKRRDDLNISSNDKRQAIHSILLRRLTAATEHGTITANSSTTLSTDLPYRSTIGIQLAITTMFVELWMNTVIGYSRC